MKKIGILGGTFNPIHNGHLALATAAAKQYDLEEVWLMPSKLPPHKSHFAMLPEQHRLAMAGLAAKADKRFVVSDFELLREGLTYTADTLELLTKEYPDCRFYFIIGGDSLVSFLNWRQPGKILELAALLGAGRAGIEAERTAEAAAAIQKAFPQAEIGTVELSDYPISSNEIREAFYTGTGERVRVFLPEEVYRYIKENKLFSKVTFAELDAEMRRILPRRRYLHSVAVAHLSAAYAASLGLNTEKALIAGILHDCAKAHTDEELLLECDRLSIPVTEVERRNGFLLHAKLGAYYAKNNYFITDEEIISAIRYHTTGRPGMTEYEKIVFLADYLEPFRTQSTTPVLNEIRKTAFADLDNAVYYALANTVNYLTKAGREIDKITVETYNEYKQSYE
ncbi:MAG: nicotinate-nucleotide adenylyltransferase [Lachnospiraceae bacterium]|nr:nicotinate-nucleotide adenylyltransferase [Lachnospiraceae bacterium]